MESFLLARYSIIMMFGIDLICSYIQFLSAFSSKVRSNIWVCVYCIVHSNVRTGNRKDKRMNIRCYPFLPIWFIHISRSNVQLIHKQFTYSALILHEYCWMSIRNCGRNCIQSIWSFQFCQNCIGNYFTLVEFIRKYHT